jgi:hypothetical protein
VYLLQAAELKDTEWSKKASQKLIEMYKSLWRAVNQVPEETDVDMVLAQRERQERQWDMAYLILSIIEELKINRIPNDKESEQVTEIFQFLSGYESDIKKFLSDQPAGQGKTLEAKKREGLFREGRVRK